MPARETIATVVTFIGLGVAVWAQVASQPSGPGGGVALLIGLVIGSCAFASGVYIANDGPLTPWSGETSVRLGTVRGMVTIADLTTQLAKASLEKSTRVRIPVLVAALLLGVATFLLSENNAFTPMGVVVWGLSLLFYFSATWTGTMRKKLARSEYSNALAWMRALPTRFGLDGTPGTNPGLTTVQVPWVALVVGAMLIAGATVLFWRIADIPREMTSDHAEKLLDVQDVLDGDFRIFFPRNTGREALQFYLIAAMTPLAGLSYLTMKLGTAGVAFLTLPFTFLLGRISGGLGVGLAALALEVCMRWLLQVGRVGLRFPFPPAFGAAITYFTIRAIRYRRRNDFLLLGLVIGISQHTYTALRLVPIGVACCLALAWFLDRRVPDRQGQARQLLTDSILMIGVAMLVFMPLARYAAEEPQMFLFRGLSRIASDRIDEVPVNSFPIFLSNTLNALLFFNWTSDPVWVNTIPRLPILDPISGALLILGVVWATATSIQFREVRYLYLFILTFFGMLPSIMSLAFPGENPSTVRMGAVIPIVAVFVGSAVVVACRRLARWLGVVGVGPNQQSASAGFGVGAVLIVLLLIYGSIWQTNARAYFGEYPIQHTASSQHASRFGDAVKGFVALGGQRDDVYILPGPHWADWRLVAIEAGNIRWKPIIDTVAEAKGHDVSARKRMYIVHPDDQRSLEQLTRWYPTGVVSRPTFPEAGSRPLFVTVVIPAGVIATQS